MKNYSRAKKRYVPNGAMDFNPAAWKDVKANCYSYAAGLMDAGIATPGSLSGEFLLRGSEVSAETIRLGILADNFEEIRRHSRSPEKFLIMDVYYNPEKKDVHPYHLHRDGSYSHLRAYPVAEDFGDVVVCGTQNFITRNHFDGLGLKIKRVGFDARRLGYVEHIGCFAMREEGIEYFVSR